ncbi:MAG TPA: YihY/virulence factor BrkB family protein, partial [Nitrospirota bacterium]|nr:YihY/virulence factor BrkB family protein [Nitrospirota bacterium]
SVALFLWTGSLVFGSLEYSMNVIFKKALHRRFLLSKLIGFMLVVISGVMFTFSFWLTYIPGFMIRHQNVFTRSDVVVFLTESLVLKLAPVFLTSVSFTLLYKILPNVEVRLRHAALAGLAAAALWEASKYAFAWYVGHFADLTVYGSLGAIVVFMLWIYLSSTILLLVAEFLHAAVHGEMA